jgi:ketosteroid isomerase-like protein
MARRSHYRSLALLFATGMGLAYAFPACASVVHHSQQKKDSRETVLALEEEWRKAQLTGDIAAMDRLLSDDFVGITAFGQVNTKAQQLARTRNHDVVLSRLDLYDVKVKLIGKIAIVTSRAEVTGINDGVPISGTFRYTRVYQRFPTGVWKITSFEATHVHGDGSAGRMRPEPEDGKH